jgi:hypothetical protein
VAVTSTCWIRAITETSFLDWIIADGGFVSMLDLKRVATLAVHHAALYIYGTRERRHKEMRQADHTLDREGRRQDGHTRMMTKTYRLGVFREG